MSISPGQRLGPYEVLSVVGAGGMGEVYRARDTRLGRIVAIKVLGGHLSDKSELRERFEREAHAVANLNHPHICVLHDVGREGDIDYIVIEYLEGDTLATKLANGPLPLTQALTIATQVADALDAAHRQGITHRDLKPANIMLTKSGAKLLDFGLAKLHAPQGDATTVPTVVAASSAGMIVGTIQYMAPEQLEGKPADARSDIYALGAVIQEMLTGKRAFDGIVPVAPPALDRVVKRSLARDPEDRWQSVRDIAAELKWVRESEDSAALHPPTAVHTRRPNRRILAAAVGVVLVGGALTGLAIRSFTSRSTATPAIAVTRLTITLPDRDVLATNQQRVVMAFSPAGDRLAYVGLRDGKQQLFVRSMDSLDVLPLAGTEGAISPFFSPDGQWIGFAAGGKLKKIPATGGVVVPVADATGLLTAVWGGTDRILFNDSPGGPLTEIGADGGAARPLQRKSAEAASGAAFLPNGSDILFVSVSTPYGMGQITARSLDTGEERPVVPNGAFPRYVSSGHLIFWRAGSLFAAPFDTKTLQITGAELAVLDDVAPGNFAVSNNGSLAYITGVPPGDQRRIVWVSRNGDRQPVDAPIRAYDAPQIAPDGRRIALEIGAQTWIYDFGRNALTRLTFEGNTNDSPIWSPDGTRIAVRSDRAGTPRVFWQLADGGGDAEQLTDGKIAQLPRSFSPDGQTLAYQEVSNTTRRDVWLVRMKDHKAEPFLRTPATEGAAKFSPDGKWLAYVSDETGRPEVYVQPVPVSGSKWQVSIEGGTEPAWNRNGRELFFRNGNRMFAVDVTTQPIFSAGKPQVLFEGNFARSEFPLTGAAYDVSPDGQRFVMLEDTGQNTTSNVIDVVLNWTEELKRRVPVKR
jgi:eukaryotic-like serine/threonine-protein kinase